MERLVTLWRFARPHTVAGSAISICTLYAMVIDTSSEQHFGLLIAALTIGISCNIFIVGINQVADVEIDRINKPRLPIPSGALSVGHARIIAYAALCISLGLSLYISPYLLGIIAFSAGIGWAYSMPPLRLKRHHLTAALAITMVRGVVVNVGGFLLFNYLVNGSLAFPEDMWILTGFIVVFSIAIAWFKDLPDVQGDAKFRIRTLAILYSPKTVLTAGALLVALAYVFTIGLKYVDLASAEGGSFRIRVLLGGHVALFVLFIINAFSVRLGRYEAVREFYKRFWWFFFAEYVLYLVAYIDLREP